MMNGPNGGPVPIGAKAIRAQGIHGFSVEDTYTSDCSVYRSEGDERDHRNPPMRGLGAA